MEYLLDNPAWYALTTGNKHLANGNGQVKYFDQEVSPFFAFKENPADSLRILHELAPHDGPFLHAASAETDIPPMWKVLNCVKSFQMVYDVTTPAIEATLPVVNLIAQHVPQMLKLTELTKPGPFGTRTIEFGHYQGVFDGDKLVAMAGQRMHPAPYAEISAVCTHPDYTGKGYAQQLLLHQVNRIKAVGETPFLHVRYDNERAIKVYQNIGFAKRIMIWFYVLYKA
jgi:GNAT superfamily N-acetyltransferase